MRKLAVVGAALLALAGAAVVLLPGLIDWNALKPEIAAAVKRATGRDVAIDGVIRVALVPRPTMTATELRIEPTAAEPAPPLSLDVLELRLAPWPLLFGRLRFERLRLVGPKLNLSRDGSGQLNVRLPGADAVNEWGRLSLEDLVVEDGSVTWQDGDGRVWRVDDLNLWAVAKSLAGPLSASGRLTLAGEPASFALTLDRLGADGTIAVSTLEVRLADGLVSVGFRGRLGNGALDGSVGVRAGDAALLASALGWPASLLPPGPAPALAADARIKGDLTAIGIEGLKLRLANSQMEGRLKLSFADTARLEGDLYATRVDLDAPWPPAPRKPSRRRAPSIGWRLPADLSGALRLHIDGIAWRRSVLRQVETAFDIVGGRLVLAKARALLPGGGEVVLTGSATAAAEALFDGRLEARAENLRRLCIWLGLDMKALRPGRPGRLSIAGDLRLTPELLRLSGAALRLDDTVAEGGLVYRLQGRPSFGLELALDSLDLADYLIDGAAVAPPTAALRRFDSNLKLRAQRLAFGPRVLTELSLDAGLVGGQLSVREARAELAGGVVTVHANASGFPDAPAYIGDLQYATTTPLAALAAFGLMPAAGAGGLAALNLDARFEGADRRFSFQATGRLGDNVFEATGGIEGPLAESKLNLAMAWPEARLGQLLPALGLALPAGIDGGQALSLDARLSGTPNAISLGLQGGLAGADLTASGRIFRTSQGQALDLQLGLKHADAAAFASRLGLVDLAAGLDGPLSTSARLQASADGLALEDLAFELGGERLGGDLKFAWPGPRLRVDSRLAAGEFDLGRWLALAGRISPQRLRRLEGALRLDADTLLLHGIRLRQAALRLDASPGVVAIESLQGMAFDGTLSLGGRLIAAEPRALSLKGELTDADLGHLSTTLLGLDGIDGRLSLSFALQSFAADPADLGPNLSGSVAAVIRDGRVTGLELSPIGQALADGTDIEDAVRRSLGAGATAFASARGAWHLSDGAIRTDDTSAALAGARAGLVGEIDFAKRRLDLRVQLRPDVAPGAPPVALHLRGSTLGPSVSVDAAAFSAYLRRRPEVPPDRLPGP